MKNKNRTIIVDFGNEDQYQEIILDTKIFLEFVIAYILSLDFQLLHKSSCTGGNCLTRHSHYARVKCGGITIWRIQCKKCKAVFTVIPSFLIRYFSYRSEQVKKALIAYHGGLSLENCTICFNIKAMALYRIICTFGKYSLPSIFYKAGLTLPKNAQVDEKHTKCMGDKGYIPMLTCGHTIWHIDYVESLDNDTLESSYRKFSEETKVLDADYSPETITHDGFRSTINAMRNIFKKTAFLICWIHSCWSIAKLLKPFSKEEGEQLSEKLFDALNKYHSKISLQCLSLRSWFSALLRKYKKILPEDLYESLKKWIKRRKPYFYTSMDYPLHLSFSFSLDHICNHLDRKLFNMKYFHCHESRKDRFLKGFALVHCLIPYQRFAKNAHKSPVQVDGAKLPHVDWFVSLSILTSGGYHKM